MKLTKETDLKTGPRTSKFFQEKKKGTSKEYMENEK